MASILHFPRMLAAFATLFFASLLFSTAPVYAQSACKGLSKSRCDGSNSCSYVNGFTRSDGAKVKAFCRAKPGQGTTAKKSTKKKTVAKKSTSSSTAKASTKKKATVKKVAKKPAAKKAAVKKTVKVEPKPAKKKKTTKTAAKKKTTTKKKPTVKKKTTRKKKKTAGTS